MHACLVCNVAQIVISTTIPSCFLGAAILHHKKQIDVHPSWGAAAGPSSMNSCGLACSQHTHTWHTQHSHHDLPILRLSWHIFQDITWACLQQAHSRMYMHPDGSSLQVSWQCILDGSSLQIGCMQHAASKLKYPLAP